LPGGKLDFGETPAKGAVREVKEETGYDVEIRDLLGIYFKNFRGKKVTVMRIVFTTSIIRGELKFPKDELLDARWFTPSEILAMKDSQLRGVRGAIEDFINNEHYPLGIIKNTE